MESNENPPVPDIHDWPRLALYKTAAPIASHRPKHEFWFPARRN